MKLYETNLTDFSEVDSSIIEQGLNDGTITLKEKFVTRHIVPEESKRAAKSAEEIFYELKENGIPVEIHNGIFCKIVYGTFEAINSLPAIDDWDEYEEVYVKGE